MSPDQIIKILRDAVEVGASFFIIIAVRQAAAGLEGGKSLPEQSGDLRGVKGLLVPL